MNKLTPKMKKILLFVVSAILLSGCKTLNYNKGFNMNQESIVLAVIWFQSTPEVKAHYYQGFNLAKERVAEYNKNKGDKPLAVVVDIDETMIDNSLFQGKCVVDGVGYTTDRWAQWTALKKAKDLPGAVNFSHFCDSLGVEVFYVSNRKVTEKENTMRNLDSLGFAFVRDQNFLLKETSSGKEERRLKISENYEIILLIGDNLNDFSDVFESRGDDWGVGIVEKYKNEFGKRYIILPNPMYGDWEKNIYGEKRIESEDEKFLKRRQSVKSF